MKDLAIIIQSRSRPDHLLATIETLHVACNSKDNFDIFCLIDDDQIDIYQPTRNVIDSKYQCRWHICDVEDKTSWFALVKEKQEIMESNDYYFNWVLTDDSVIHGISKDFDSKIIENKDKFKDGLFVLYTLSAVGGRNETILRETSGVHHQAYDVYSDINIDGQIILHHNEMLPIWTKPFIKLWWDIFKEGNYSSMQEMITAALVYKLKTHYNLNRHIPANVLYGGMDAGDGEVSQSALVKNKDGLNRDETYIRLVESDFKELMPTVSNMFNYIKNYPK